MCGVFLTILDEEGKILMFAGGAQRRREEVTDENGKTTISEQLIVMTPQDLFRGFQTQTRPEYRTLTAEQLGADTSQKGRRSQWTIDLYECPYLSLAVGHYIPQAACWGVLHVGPDDGQAWVRKNGVLVPNGQNKEKFLSDRNWMVDDDAGAPNFQGGNDMFPRLATGTQSEEQKARGQHNPFDPQDPWEGSAVHIAQTRPTAWQLAIASCKLFGGFSRVPAVEVYAPSAVISMFVNGEYDVREKKQQEEARKRAERQIQESSTRHLRRERKQLVGALNPSEQHEQKLAAVASPEAMSALDKVREEISDPAPAAEIPVSPDESNTPEGEKPTE